MINFLIQKDIDFFLFLNGFNNLFWDKIMYIISGKFTWIPLYISVLIYFFKKHGIKQTLIYFFVFIILVILTDQSSVHLFKNVFERLRPCHNSDISEYIHNPFGCGGKYGFVSSHAANSFGFCVLSLLLIKNRIYSVIIIFWALLVSYSRVYLGVHYPADVLVGGFLGCFWTFVLYKIFLILSKVFNIYKVY